MESPGASILILPGASYSGGHHLYRRKDARISISMTGFCRMADLCARSLALAFCTRLTKYVCLSPAPGPVSGTIAVFIADFLFNRFRGAGHHRQALSRALIFAPFWLQRIRTLAGNPGRPITCIAWRPQGTRLHTWVLCTILTAISLPALHAQAGNDLVALGISAEKSLKTGSALKYYQKAAVLDTLYAEARWRASRLHSSVAGRQTDKEAKRHEAQQARELALVAIQLEPANKEAHLAYIVAMGLLAEAADGPSEKIHDARVIRAEAEYLLRLDSTFAPAHYILGKWHYEMARFTWLERLACNMLFGGAPEDVSFSKSIMCYDRAIHFQPSVILFHYAKAVTLYQLDRYEEAEQELEIALLLAPADPDDFLRHKKCQDLLGKSKKLNPSGL